MTLPSRVRPIARTGRIVALVVVCTSVVGLYSGIAFASTGPAPTPQAVCGPGARPETGAQGRVPSSDYDNGRTKLGYACNVDQVGHEGNSGGFRVFRYVDAAGHECAYYDTTLLVGVSLLLSQDAGVAVLDMKDPGHPVRTATLRTPAMISPHESLNLNVRRGLLAAIMGSPGTAPGFVDIYDVASDCRHPVLKASAPVGVAGHEATFAPDGNTFYVTATALPYVSAIDVTNPSLPTPVWISTTHTFHGMNVSDDGNRLYGADLGDSGLTILDVSQVQRRVANPSVPVVSHITWPNVSIPQTAIPVTIGGRPYLVEIDEYAGSASNSATASVGAGRIIDILDEAMPEVVGNMRLQVNEPADRLGPQADDPGAGNPAQGYAGHYCSVPQRQDPGIVACSFIISGLRVFDIHDPRHPREISYFNPPSRTFGPAAGVPGSGAASSAAAAGPNLYTCRIAVTAANGAAGGSGAGASAAGGSAAGGSPSFAPFRGSTLSYWAMSAPAFAPERNEVWYSDGMYGFYSLRLTNGVWQPSSPGAAQTLAPAGSSGPTVLADQLSRSSPGSSSSLPSTGGTSPFLQWAVAAAAAAFASRRLLMRAAPLDTGSGVWP